MRQMAASKGFYSVPEGLPALRNAIAGHIAFSRGINCQDEDIVVCNGAQQALDLISRVLISPGSRVAMEDPGYPPARLLFGTHGAQVVGVPVDAEGIEVEQIPEGTRLIYVTPSHQFPLGMSMSQARREALLARAYELGAIIIEDDYDSEFRYEGRPTDSLHDLDQRGIVAYVGTFSKTLLPELRLGYAILPPAILEAVIRAKKLTDQHAPTLPQWALAKFIAEGCLLKHIRRCHAIYAQRRERILARMATDLSPWLDAVPASAGLSYGGALQGADRSAAGDRTGEKGRSRPVLHRRFSMTSNRRKTACTSASAPSKRWTLISLWIACATSCNKLPE